MDSSQQHLFAVEEIKTLRYRNRKKHNQYFTPEFGGEKALSLVPIAEVKSIIDPAVGNGVFLKIASKKWNNAKLFGVDIDTTTVRDLKREKPFDVDDDAKIVEILDIKKRDERTYT